MKINKVFCLFEQSGTFKNEFIRLGIPAEDYDIQNNFEQTDHVIDLFEEINNGYNNEPSIFDEITPDDLIISFFPCIRFENQIMLFFRGQASQQKKWDFEKKCLYDMKLLNEVKYNYELVNKMFLICYRRNLRLIMENPYSEEHFLRRYWHFPAAIIDRNRQERGDYYVKPTQFWFMNCEPEHNLIVEDVEQHRLEVIERKKDAWSSIVDWSKTGAKTKKEARSMMHPDYANRFIREFIL